VMIFVLILELPAMFKLVHWAVVMRRLSGDQGLDYATAYVLDSELSFRRLPNVRWSGRPPSDLEQSHGLPRSLQKPITFTYDRWGYRNVRPMAQADIVLIGDSFVEGWFVSDDQTIASYLGNRLHQAVANLGVAGYGTLQEAIVLKGDAMARRPRVIAWFFYEGNDLYDDQEFENTLLAGAPSREETEFRTGGPTRGHGWKRRSFILNAFMWVRRWADPVVPNRAPNWVLLPAQGEKGRSKRIYLGYYGATPWRDYEESRWAISRAELQRGVEFARERGVSVVLVYVPIKFRVYRPFVEIPEGSSVELWSPWPLPAKFHDLCESIRVPCVDLTDRLQSALRDGVDVYPATDTHWSPEGNELVAAELERVLRDIGWASPPATGQPEIDRQDAIR